MMESSFRGEHSILPLNCVFSPPWIKSDHRLLTLKPYSLGRYFFQYFHTLPLTTIGGSRVGRLWKVSECKSKSLVKFWLLPYLVHTIQLLFPTIQVLVLCQCSDKEQMFKMSVLKPYYGDNLQLIKPNWLLTSLGM